MTLEELIAAIEEATEIEDKRAQLTALRTLRSAAASIVEKRSPADREIVNTCLQQGLGADALTTLRRLQGRRSAA